MIKVLNFLVKVLATIIASIGSWVCITLALIMWNAKFMEIGVKIYDYVWERKN